MTRYRIVWTPKRTSMYVEDPRTGDRVLAVKFGRSMWGWPLAKKRAFARRMIQADAASGPPETE